MLTQERHTLNGRGAGADNGNLLIRQFGQSACVITTCVVIVPTRRMEGMALERLDTGNAGQFRSVSGACCLDNKLRFDVVVMIS